MVVFTSICCQESKYMHSTKIQLVVFELLAKYALQIWPFGFFASTRYENQYQICWRLFPVLGSTEKNRVNRFLPCFLNQDLLVVCIAAAHSTLILRPFSFRLESSETEAAAYGIQVNISANKVDWPCIPFLEFNNISENTAGMGEHKALTWNG